jgi:hypothetical protein
LDGYKILTYAILLFAFIPSILPIWRHMLIAAGVLYILLTVMFFVSLGQIDAMTSGEGPAFFGMAFLFGMATTILMGSCISRFAIIAFLSYVKPNTRLCAQRFLIVFALLIIILLAYAVIGFYINYGFAVFVSAAAIWLSLVAWLVPKSNNLR